MAEKNNNIPDGITSGDMKNIIDINKKFNDYFRDVASNTIGQDFRNSNELDDLTKKLDGIIRSEYDSMTTYTGKDFAKFIDQALKGTGDGYATNGTDLEKVINEDANAFSSFFYERYKNINNKYEDLRMVTEYLCELSTAVTTLRDNVTASDGVIGNISKTIEIRDLSREKEGQLRQIVTEVEEKYGIEGKIHGTIVPNALTFGDYFVYHQPYNRIFSKFEMRKKEQPEFLSEATLIPTSLVGKTNKGKNKSTYDISKDVEYVFESVTASYKALPDDVKRQQKAMSRADVRASLEDIYSHIEVINDGSAPLMEDASIASLTDKMMRKVAADAKRNAEGKSSRRYSDGVVSLGGVNTEDVHGNTVLPEYQDVTGVYMKLLSPLRTVPVFVLDECIGYYILYETYGEIRNNMLQNNQLNRTNMLYTGAKNRDTASSIVDVITNRIIEKIDKKFLKNNIQFRELMVNAIMYQDLYKKDFRVQFVSAEFMTHFKVNEDIETHLGTSMLKRSLFYAKMYMTILMFNIISTVTRSNDTRVFYIKNSGIDKNIQKQVQKAAREYKENQISYNDIASVNTLISKAGKAKDLFVGTGRSGERPVDFDIISGQSVDIDNDFISFLRKNMINGTDVPSVILEYNESADFARSIEMGNIKYANKIASVQKELNIPVTMMYRAIIKFEHPEIPPDDVDRLYFRFNRPKALGVQNDADMYNNAESAATFLVKAICGDNTEKYTDSVKDQLFRYIVKEHILPGMYDWEELQKKADQILRSAGQDKQEAELTNNESSTDE